VVYFPLRTPHVEKHVELWTTVGNFVVFGAGKKREKISKFPRENMKIYNFYVCKMKILCYTEYPGPEGAAIFHVQKQI